MDDLVDRLTQGNVSQVKTVLASIATALAFYQVALMAVVYGKVRAPFLQGRAASFAHRGIGDTALVIALVVAYMCLSYFEVEDGIEYARDGETARATVHVVAGFLLVAAFAAKVAVVRWLHGLGRFLPLIGLSIFVLLLVTWVTSAANFLWWS